MNASQLEAHGEDLLEKLNFVQSRVKELEAQNAVLTDSKNAVPAAGQNSMVRPRRLRGKNFRVFAYML